MARTGVCCIVENYTCKAWANQEIPGPVGTCFACGLDVCVASTCSSRIYWYWFGRKRICANCKENILDLKRRIRNNGPTG